MQCQYVGFRVKLCSSQLGDVEGTVSKVAESRIELSQAIINGKGLPIPSLVVESQFIQNIRILSTGSGDSSEDISPKKDEAVVSGRAQRREMLRNMPNACNAYVCPNSPPLIHRSVGIPVQQPTHTGSPGIPGTSHMKQLDSALARVTLSGLVDRKRSKQIKPIGTTPVKRRSRSFSETVPSNSDISGAESDSFHRSHVHTNRGVHSNGIRYGPNRTYGRCGGNGSVVGANRGGRSQQSTADWDRIRVEEFIDEDFDFEKNLAMFDKNAFYEMVDMREGNAHRPNASNPPPSQSQLDEGPNGVGMPLIGTTRHSEPSESNNAVYYSDVTQTTNTPTLSSSKQRREFHTPYYQTSLESSGELKGTGCVTSVTSRSRSTCTTHSSQAQSRCWFSAAGYRVPILSVEDQGRMLHYLATGIDPLSQKESVSSNELPPLAHGLSWGRVLETAGRSLVDQIMSHVRQTNQTPQRSFHRPPPRILVLPGGPHLSGALCVTIARLLAMRGGCVLAMVPKCSLTDTPTKSTGKINQGSSVYRNELNLTLQFSPRPSLYGLEDDEEESGGKSLDDYDEEEEAEDSAVSVAFDPAAATSTEMDSDGANCLTLDQLMHGQATDPLDYSPVHRMWISRMPGFKLLHRPLSILKIPTNVRVDLVIIGHEPAESVTMDSHLLHWLQQHQALSCAVHIMPRANIFKEPAFCNFPSRWIVELGLPVLLPSQLMDPPPSSVLGSKGSASGSYNTSHFLVDVGLSRNLVRRLTSDLKLLPPYGLFDTSSVIPLRASLNSNTSENS
ncbi:hypothetical protein FGIG_05486 [Fasciola gigantica]|uniref:DFDF domain-containing protein n=1 Tax=Fasciola gigantica TaxID=46835 RepID=A0A504Z104_FASGI|nr:hypothetical protein FGIG_05486 [Fasciola gigantica]